MPKTNWDALHSNISPKKDLHSWEGSSMPVAGGGVMKRLE